MSYNNNSKRIILTLDAGGTNFSFSAIQNGNIIINPIVLPSKSHDLDLCLSQVVTGFKQVIEQLSEDPDAISFAFPGPADYQNGIIGGYLPNFPSFRDGVALGPYLESIFKIPVYINNDADLYAYGEAKVGKLTDINQKLCNLGIEKQYKNLLGYTFGTGFGFGFVSNGEMHTGDNSCVETFCLPHKDNSNIIVEDGVSIRAVKRIYAELTGISDHNLEPKEIFEIAEGNRPGDKNAAIKTFNKLGEVAGDAIATSVTLIDGIIVIGGGLIAAKKYIMPSLLKQMRGTINTINGETLNRVQMKVYNLDDENEFVEFAKGSCKKIPIYGTDKFINYSHQKKIGICTTSIGASKAISLGAAMFAINKLNNN